MGVKMGVKWEVKKGRYHYTCRTVVIECKRVNFHERKRVNFQHEVHNFLGLKAQ